MALTDLGNLFISQSYQKVVQTEGGLFADGLGNPLALVTTSDLAGATVATASYAQFAVTASFIALIDGGSF
jgi:hypothetical protein